MNPVLKKKLGEVWVYNHERPLDSLTKIHCVGCSCHVTILHDFCFKRFVPIRADDFEILVFSAECVRVF
jgi:hypothetical protein